MIRPYAEVIGDPIAHSKSPLIHNFWLEKLGINANYQRHHIGADALADYLVARRSDPLWRGCNVTVPHKERVLPLLDRLTPAATAIGAVNTVIIQNNQLVGDNTDEGGFLEPLIPLLGMRAPDEASAIIIGAGGAARAVAVALWRQGYGLQIANRSHDRARSVADQVAGARSSDIQTPSLHQLRDLSLGAGSFQPFGLRLVVNTSVMGMVGQDALDFSLAHVPRDVVIYDLVYAPLMTPLLLEAQACGLRTIDGLQMLVGQAAKAFTLFFGQLPPRQYDDQLRLLLSQ